MLTKRSRYYPLEEVVHPDRAGILRKTTSLRPLPAVSGKFFHTVESDDRLDHLAYKYYRQSLHWWRVCDANPDAPSPRHLVGQVPQEALTLSVRWQGNNPSWNDLFRALRDLVGVEHILKGGFTAEEQLLEPAVVVDEDSALFTLPESLRAELDEGVNTQVYPTVLEAELSAEGLMLNGPLRFSKLGAQRWRIEALASGEYYVFSYSDSTDEVTVYDTTLTYDWSLAVTYNTNTLAQEELLAAIVALGFIVIDVEVLTRIGQRIVIPPRYTGV